MEFKLIEPKEFKAGYLYAELNHFDGKVMITGCKVCIGNCIANRFDYSIVASIHIPTIYLEDDGQDIIKMVKAGVFEEEVRVGVAYFGSCLYCIGRVIDSGNIQNWVTQLKLRGYKVEIESLVRKDGYIGDWTLRKKLPCVRKFTAGHFYMKEGLAYIRQKEGELYKTDDYIWYYYAEGGVAFGGGYIWLELPIGEYAGFSEGDTRTKLDRLVTSRVHRVNKLEKQPSCMVKFDPKQWVISERI